MSIPVRRYVNLLRLLERGSALDGAPLSTFASEGEAWAIVVREHGFTDIDARADFEKATHAVRDSLPGVWDIRAALAALKKEGRSTAQGMSEEEARAAMLHWMYVAQIKTETRRIAATISELSGEFGVAEERVRQWIERGKEDGLVTYYRDPKPGKPPDYYCLTEDGLRRAADPVSLIGPTQQPPRSIESTATGSTEAEMRAARIKLEGSNWEPVRELGRGGGGVVYLCVNADLMRQFSAFADRIQNQHRIAHHGGVVDPNLEFVVPMLVERLVGALRDRDAIAAVKIPHFNPNRPTDTARFQREVGAMQKYHHPALIRLLDVDRKSPSEWCALECHRQGVLEEPRHRNKYLGNPLAVLKDVRPIADALGVLHRGGAVHRDIKPRNIFVADDGHLVLGDFGIVVPGPDAPRLTAVEPAHSRDWVPDWVQFGQERTYTSAVDVFALAKVIYYLVAGENVMASQLYKGSAALNAKYSDAAGMVATLHLLERCIVERQEKVTILDGGTLLREIDAVLAESADQPAHLVFSFLSVRSTADLEIDARVQARQDSQLSVIKELHGMPFFLARPTRNFLVRARMYRADCTLQLRVDDVISQVWNVPSSARTNTVDSPGAWTSPITLRFHSPISAGWHDLTLTGAGTGVLTGLLVYAP